VIKRSGKKLTSLPKGSHLLWRWYIIFTKRLIQRLCLSKPFGLGKATCFAGGLLLNFLMILVVVGVFIAGGMCYLIESAPINLFTSANIQNNYEPYGYVAHALGSIDGRTYTNSKEAFELNYKKGFRIFEVDIVLLKDGTVFCAHNNVGSKYGLSKSFAETTMGELSGTLCLGKYTPLNGSQLLDLLNEYKDVYIITDTKYSHIAIMKILVAEAKKKYPSVLDRIIPHIAGASDLRQMRRIYPFRYYMLALYRSSMNDDEVVEFVEDSNISAVMMWWDIRYTHEFKERLKRVGAVTYVHSLSDPEKIASFRKQGVGVYTNCSFPE